MYAALRALRALFILGGCTLSGFMGGYAVQHDSQIYLVLAFLVLFTAGTLFGIGIEERHNRGEVKRDGSEAAPESNGKAR